MPSAGHREVKSAFNLRATRADKALLARAAKVAGKDRTAFVLDAAREKALDTLADQKLFMLSSEAYAAFLARLDEEPRPNDALRWTMQATPPWKQG